MASVICIYMIYIKDSLYKDINFTFPFWNKMVVSCSSKFLLYPSSVFQPVRRAFSSRLKEMSPACSVPSTAAPPVKAPSIAFAATDTIAPTRILSRCRAQVRSRGCHVWTLTCTPRKYEAFHFKYKRIDSWTFHTREQRSPGIKGQW